MVERKEYLDQLWAWKDEQQIKVVTGIRRCGKSVLLEQYQQRLLANGVTPEQIISINFENLDYEPLKDYMKLYNYLKERLCADKMTYIFLDEVQEVPSFEKVVDSLYIRDHVDVYITGSNAYIRKRFEIDDVTEKFSAAKDNCQISGKRYRQSGVYEKYNRLPDLSGKESIPKHSQ